MKEKQNPVNAPGEFGGVGAEIESLKKMLDGKNAKGKE